MLAAAGIVVEVGVVNDFLVKAPVAAVFLRDQSCREKGLEAAQRLRGFTRLHAENLTGAVTDALIVRVEIALNAGPRVAIPDRI